jgi:hypothetical protein
MCVCTHGQACVSRQYALRLPFRCVAVPEVAFLYREIYEEQVYCRHGVRGVLPMSSIRPGLPA